MTSNFSKQKMPTRLQPVQLQSLSKAETHPYCGGFGCGVLVLGRCRCFFLVVDCDWWLLRHQKKSGCCSCRRAIQSWGWCIVSLKIVEPLVSFMSSCFNLHRFKDLQLRSSQGWNGEWNGCHGMVWCGRFHVVDGMCLSIMISSRCS